MQQFFDLNFNIGENPRSCPQESGKAVVSLMSSITKLAEISEIETLAIRRW